MNCPSCSFAHTRTIEKRTNCQMASSNSGSARVIENTVKSDADVMPPFRDNPISISLKDYHF